MAEQFCDNCGLANAETARFCQHCAAPLLFKHSTGDLPEQTLLGNRYQLEARIGQGGMGAVYKAADTRFNNRSVAIKEMSRAGLTPSRIQEAEDAFERESRLLADLVHPNLPRIYDYFTEEERSYLVMDFIEGETLEEYLEHKGGGPVNLEQALDWGMQICDVLSHLHTHQPPIIFRDLKPSNVMLSNGHVYLIDFGIARIFKPGQSHDTVAFGSPGFAAPEQYGKTQSTPRSDIYSLGALLHCLLTGVDPSEQPFFFRPASELNPVVPVELENLLTRMLELKVENRPASAQEVTKTLRHIEDQRISGTLTRRTVPRAAASQTTATKAPNVTVPPYVPSAANTQIRDAHGWQAQGTTYGMNGRHQEALTAFERALRMDNKLVTAWNGKGTALNMLRRNQEALAAFEQALKLEADNALAWNGKGAAQNALGLPEQALFSFDTALHYEPRLAQALNNKGLILRQLRRFPESLRAFEQAITNEPDNSVFWNGKGNVLYDLGRFQDALSAYQEARKLNANYAPTYYGLGNVYYAQQKLKLALENYDKALQFDRNYVRAYDKRGNVLADQKRLVEALNAYDQALRIDPRNASVLNSKASVLTELGQHEEALRAYKAAIHYNPKAPLAWNGLGNVHYHLHNYQESLEAYDRATQLNPRMASAWHNKSLVLKQLKRNEDALEAAEEAVKLAPNDPDNWRRKAEALRKLTRRKAAREAEAEVARLTGGA